MPTMRNFVLIKDRDTAARAALDEPKTRAFILIRELPTVAAELLRALRGLSAKRVSAIFRQIRDGDW